MSFNENSIDEDELSDNIDFVVSLEIDENKKDPLESHRSEGNETLVVNNNIMHEIALGEGKRVESLLNSNCEYLLFPHLFSSAKFGMVQNCESKLPVSLRFNQRLLNYTHRFSSNADYIFYAQSVLQQIQFQNQISIAMRNVSGDLNALVFRNYKESVDNLVRSDQGFLFMSKIRGTPAYWKRFQSEVLAIVKQLGCPSFFLTLSCADLKWNDLVEVILKSRNLQMAAVEIASMDYFTRCKFLNDNPVTVVRHFQYRVEVFFREVILISDPLSNVKYYAIRVEFQVRGSPHIHSFLWVINEPATDQDPALYVEYLDSVISATFPSRDDDAELYKLVKTY